MAKKKEPIGWFTMNGRHVPIYEGESKAQAISRATKESVKKQQENIKKNEDQKAKDIAKNKAEKDKLNGKSVNNNSDISSKKYDDIKKDLDNMKTGDIVEYTFKNEDGETGKEIYVKQKDGSYKMKNGYGEHDDSEYLADYMKENNKGSYKVRDLAKEDSDRLAKANKQISDYNKQKEEGPKKSNALSEDKLNDAVKYYKENSFGYDSIEDYVRTDFPFASKEKQDEIIKAMTNKISGGSFSDSSSGKAVDGVKGSSGNKDWSKQDIQKLADSRKISYDEAKKIVERYNKPDNAGDAAVDRFRNASAGKASDDARVKKEESSSNFREQAKSIVAKEKETWKNIKTTSEGLSHLRYLSKHELKDIPDSKLKDMYPYHKNQVGVEIAEELLNRGYQKVGSGWQVKVPKSFAANYPNLSSSELKKKYQEYLKKNRK